MRFFFLFFLVLLVRFGEAQTITTETLTVGGVQRSYVLYVPASYTPGTPVPLLFNFHGYTSNANQQMAYGDFRPIAEAAGFLVAHPEGLPLPGTGQPHWNVGGWTTASQSDDLGFTDAMIAEISANYSIDERRIYSTGFSNGGFFSFELACRRSGVIAAIGSVAGTLTPEQESAGCSPDRAVPVVQIHGTNDATIPYASSSGYSEPALDAVGLWRSYNGASNALPAVPIDTDPNDGTTVDHFRYTTPGGQQLVEHYRVNGGAHTWPGNAFNQANTTNDISASQVVWDFVSQFSLPAALPVRLATFGVRATDGGATVHWTSAAEAALAHYLVERRGESGDWQLLGRVAARQRPAAYTYPDAAPVPGTAYYRLRSVDLDGTESFGAAVPFVWKPAAAPFTLRPNPAGNYVEVVQSEADPTSYELRRTDGRLVRTGLLRGRRTQLPLDGLAAGVYLLRVGQEVQRLVVR